jgi:hypothetical protein
MPTFNGHHCWNCWNVSLWLGNDEGLHRAAVEEKSRARTLGIAARRLLADLPKRTPDGARYTFKAVYAYMCELEA